ncbi:PREDICTED: probable polygalacturonase, partial [Tarenaya hassleriana]|uniref:probable polygalacturonase n=1 Tax=Tarenaya hassleriana TaxID=28532 RepID=UPI00053C47D4
IYIDVVVKNLTILAPLESPNTDGVDPDSSNDVCIEDCYIVTGDDLVSIKSGWDEYGISYARPSTRIKISRLTGQTTSSSGIAIGSEMSGGVSEIHVEDVHLYNSKTGIRIKTSPGRGGYVRNVYVSNVKLENVSIAIRFTGQYGEHPDGKYDPKAFPLIEKITFENFTGDSIGVAGLFQGIEGDEFKNICLVNVSLQVKSSRKSPWKCSYVRGYSQWVSPDITCDPLQETIFPDHSSDCYGLKNVLQRSGSQSRRSWLLSW